MNSTPQITYAQLDEAIASLRLGVGPSDLHGSLTGYLCAGARADAQDWLAALALEAQAGTHLSNATLRSLREQCAAWLGDPQLRFEPLLPTSDNPVAVRAEALVEWCRGFLGGLGLAGILPHDGLSDDAQEILRDFAAIAASRFEYADNEEDENALTEVIEFIRVGVMLLHTELSILEDGKPTLH
ncbi:MAG: UPF0149 family protein [Rudaea sp.]